MRLNRLLVSALLSAMPGLTALAQPQLTQQGLVFSTETNDFRAIGMGIRSVVSMSGIIRAGDATRLEAVIEKNHLPSAGVLFLINSPGGNLDESLQLARIIRAHSGDTEVGNPVQAGLSRPAVCYSSCTFLFLGGVNRFIPAEDTYGVHRFFFDGQQQSDRNEALDEAQRVSGMLVAFVQEMGIDAALISEMSQAGPTQINVLSQSRLRALDVITPLYKTTWSIAPLVDTFVAKAVTVDEHGTHYLQFVCGNKVKQSLHQVVMAVGVDGGNQAARTVAENHGQQLIVDGPWQDLLPTEAIVPKPVINQHDHRHLDVLGPVST